MKQAEQSDFIKIWHDGNLQLARIVSFESESLVMCFIEHTIHGVSDYDHTRHIEVNTITNIIENYGHISIIQHQQSNPEDWL